MNAIAKAIVLGASVVGASKVSPEIGTKLTAPVHMVRGVATTVELQQIQKALFMNKVGTDVYLPDEQFPDFIRENFNSSLKDPLVDSWGRPYLYRRERHGFTLRSIGPDGIFGNDDDLALRWEEKQK